VTEKIKKYVAVGMGVLGEGQRATPHQLSRAPATRGFSLFASVWDGLSRHFNVV